jgi:hypothetical protein
MSATREDSATLPLLPTTVVGSYAYPSWLWTALEEMRQGKYGETDISETLDEAVRMAILDQEEAGIDIINDGEMRRWCVFQSWDKRLSGLEALEPLRRVGVYGHDSVARYRPISRLGAPSGLGLLEAFLYLNAHTQKPIKVTCTGPLTMTMPIELGIVGTSSLLSQRDSLFHALPRVEEVQRRQTPEAFSLLFPLRDLWSAEPGLFLRDAFNTDAPALKTLGDEIRASVAYHLQIPEEA